MKVLVISSCVVTGSKLIDDYSDDELLDLVDGLEVRDLDLETFENEFNEMKLSTTKDYIRFIKEE